MIYGSVGASSVVAGHRQRLMMASSRLALSLAMAAFLIPSAQVLAADINLPAAGGIYDISGAGNTTIGSLAGVAGTSVNLGSNTLTTDTSSNTTFSGTIGGTGSLVKSGTGTLSLAGANTYTGVTMINDGTLALAGGGSLAAGGSVILGGTGTFDLSFSGANQTIGNLIGGGATSIVLGTNTLTFGNAANSAFAGRISGTGGLITNGTGTVTLTGANTYTGGTTITAGTVAIGAGGSLSSTGAVSLTGSGTTFDISAGGNQTIGALAGAAGTTVNLGSNALTTNVSTYSNFGGNIVGSGSLTKDGAGSLALTSTNTYLGGTTIKNGTLALSGTGSITPTGSVTMTGGTLDITGMLAGTLTIGALSGTGGTIQIAGKGLAVDSSSNTTFGGAIEGSGGLLSKQGTGTLTLTGANTYTSGTIIAGGTLAIGAGGSLSSTGYVSLVTAGATFDISNGGNQTIGTLAGNAGTTVKLGGNTLATGSFGNTIFNGTVIGTGGLVKKGTGILYLGGANTYTGGTTVNEGTLVIDVGGSLASTGALNLAASGTAFNISAGGNQTIGSLSGVAASTISLGANTLTAGGSATTTFSGTIYGTGGLIKTGTGNLILAGANTYSGITTVNDGTLSVNGSLLNSTTIVDNGGTLGGNGTVGNTIVASGGAIGPGNSIGTLTVNGNAAFNSGSIYKVDVDPTSSDLLHVTGTATLNGATVQVLAGAGAYAGSTRYTILTADTALTGTFGGVTSNLAFLTPTLSYTSNNVYLTLARSGTSFPDVADNPNQRGAAGAVESLGAGNAVYDAVVGLDAHGAQQAFSQLSGDAHGNAQGAVLNGSRLVGQAMMGRLHQIAGNQQSAQSASRNMLAGQLADASSGASDLPSGTSLASTSEPQASGSANGVQVWMQAIGGWGHDDSDGNAAALDRSSAGTLIGADTAIAEDWRVGGLVGYSHSWLDQSDASGKIDSLHLGAYGSGKAGPIALRAGIGYSWNQVTNKRDVDLLDETLKSDYDAHLLQLFAEAGYPVALSGVTFEPYAGFGYTHLWTDSFQEKGGAAALHGKSSQQDMPYSLLGLRASGRVASFDDMALSLRGGLGWQHVFGDVTPSASVAFGGGSSFQSQGLPIARDALVAEAGIDLAIGNQLTLGLGYDGQVASDSQAHAVNASFKWSF